MADTVPGGSGGPVVAFEQAAVLGAADDVRGAGARTVDAPGELGAALDAASAAAPGLLRAPALAECASRRARRVRDVERETDGVAAGRERAAGVLVDAEEEVARRVADAAGCTPGLGRGPRRGGGRAGGQGAVGHGHAAGSGGATDGRDRSRGAVRRRSR